MTDPAPKASGRRSLFSGGVTHVFAYVLISLPAALAFFYVGWFGVDLPVGDAWKMVPLFEKLSSGTLGLADLWAQHFEHRLFFPRIALLLLGVVTDWNNVASMYLTEFSFLVTMIVLFAAFRSSVGPRPLLFAPVAFLVFNLAQYFNMLRALQLALAFAQTFGVLALYLLYVSGRGTFRKPAFAAALASGMVASFSLGSGLLVWPAGFVQLLVTPLERRTKRLLVGAWSLAGLGAWVLYFLRLAIPERQESSFIFSDPASGAGYLLTLLGSPLAWRPDLDAISAPVVGVLLVGLVVVGLYSVYRAGKPGEYSFWVALLTFSLLTALSITAARTGTGVVHALTSRYTTFTGLVVVSVYVMLVKLTLERGSRVVKASLGVLLVVIVVGLSFSYAAGIDKGRRLERVGERDAAILSSYARRPDESLDIANRSAGYIRENAFVLCKLGYSVFSDPQVQARNCLPPPFSTLSPTESSAPSEVESAELTGTDRTQVPVIVPKKRPSVSVTGWAVDADGEGPAGGVYIEVDGKLFPAFYGSRRGGGSDAPPYEFSGFEGDIPVSKLGPGTHELSLVVVTSDRREYYRPDEEVDLRIGGGGRRAR